MAETEYIEYDETMTTQLTRKKGLTKRVMYRLKVRKGEIPFFSKGLDIKEFSYTNPTNSIRDVLRDITHSLSVTSERVTLVDVNISVPIDSITGESE